MMNIQLTKRKSTDAPIPGRCSDFAAWCGIELSPGQRAFVRIAYDGDNYADLATDEQTAAIAIFGEAIRNDVPSSARSVAAAVCGGRAGKTYVLVSIRLVHGMLVRDLSSLAPGQRAVALVVAPNDKLRQEAVNFALGLVRSKPELRRLLVKDPGADDTPSEFAIRRSDGHIVTFESGVATRGGYGGRGRSLTDFVMDEAAFFRDASYKVNDAEIFKAAAPRVLPGGQTIVVSTPWAESGLLYDLWLRNYGHPIDSIVAHAPTLALNPSSWTEQLVARERARDPDNADREFDAKFMAGGTTVFFEGAAVQAAIDASLEIPRTPIAGEEVAAGVDLGFRSDSSTLVITHRQGRKIITGFVLELRPEEGKPLKPSVVVKRFADEMQTQRCSYAMADGHYRDTLIEHMGDAKLSVAEAPTVPAEAYVRARGLLREGRIVLPDHPRLLQQLREVQGRPLPGGGMSIIHPRWRTGGHGDIVAAWVLAVYQLGGETVVAATSDPSSAAWEEAQREKRRNAAKSVNEKPWWAR